jgi:hypothetical protein
MMSEVPEAYFGWLETQTGTLEQPRSYSGLLQIMLQKEFVMNHPMDNNRIEDGLDVRREFFRETGMEPPSKMDLPCSVLEVLVALSRRLAFMAGGEPSAWAWQLIRNLELHKFADPIGRRKAIAIDEILFDLIWRQYDPDGMGGFFPLIDTDHDQREIEIWYQMAEYVEEIHSEYWERG